MPSAALQDLVRKYVETSSFERQQTILELRAALKSMKEQDVIQAINQTKNEIELKAFVAAGLSSNALVAAFNRAKAFRK